MSNDNNIEVTFGASTDGVEKGSAQAAQAVAAAVTQMKESFSSLGEQVKQIHQQISGAFDGMGAALAKFNNVMFAVQNAIQGGAMFKEFVQDAISTTKESLSLGKALGITATEASYMKSALTAVGVTQEQVVSAASKMTRTLVQNEGAFAALGVTTRDSNNHFISTNDIMQATNARLREFKEGTDRNVEGIKIYGRGWAEVAPLVSKFKGETDETRETAEKLNLVIGVEAVSAMVNYNAAQRSVNEVIDGMKNTIGQALLPQLTSMAEWFRSVGPQAVDATRIAMAGYLAIQNAVKESVMLLWNAISDSMKAIARAINGAIGQGSEGLTAMQLFENVIKVIQVAFIGLRVVIELYIAVITAILTNLADRCRLVGAVIAAALSLDWAGMKSAWSDYKAQTEKTLQDTIDSAVKIASKGREDIDKAIMGDLGAKVAVTAIAGKGEGEHSDGKAEKEKTAEADPSQVAGFRDELRLKLEAEGQFFKDSTDEQLAYWRGIRALNTLSEKDRQAVNTEVFNLTKKTLQDEHSLQVTRIDAERALGKELVALRAEQINALKQAGTISDTEALTRLRALHTAEAAADKDALQQKIDLYGTDAKEREKFLGQIAVAEQKANVASLKDTAAITASIEKTWATAFAPITSAFDTAVKGVISGTTTIGSAVKNMAKSILSEYVNMGVKTAAQWAVTEASKTAATATGTASRTALEGAAAIQSVALGAWAAIKNIMNYAWTAMAGAYQAIVSIPYVGPILAPIAAGVAFAGVAGAVSSIASARGGYDIPAGVNPMTQLHEREMVLPQNQADAVRAMADGGSAGGDIHIHGTPDDGIKLRDLPRVLKQLNRNFVFVGA